MWPPRFRAQRLTVADVPSRVEIACGMGCLLVDARSCSQPDGASFANSASEFTLLILSSVNAPVNGHLACLLQQLVGLAEVAAAWAGGGGWAGVHVRQRQTRHCCHDGARAGRNVLHPHGQLISPHQPKKPRFADRPLGCAAASTLCRALSMRLPLSCKARLRVSRSGRGIMQGAGMSSKLTGERPEQQAAVIKAIEPVNARNTACPVRICLACAYRPHSRKTTSFRRADSAAMTCAASLMRASCPHHRVEVHMQHQLAAAWQLPLLPSSSSSYALHLLSASQPSLPWALAPTGTTFQLHIPTTLASAPHL